MSLYFQEVERMRDRVKELTEDNQSQVKINTSLQSQLDGASDCKNALQERINLLEKKLQKATSSSNNNNESTKTNSGDIAELKSSEGDEGSVDVKTKASKAEPTTATLDEVKKEEQKTSLKSAQANTTPRSSLSNALSDIGIHQSVNSTNSATNKEKKATDLKSQASTTNSSKKASVSRQLQLSDENSAVTSELCSDHFDTNSEPKQDQNQTSGSISDKQVSCSSYCNLTNQGSGCDSKIIHPRRQKRQSLEEYVQSIGNNNNHQAKAKEGGTKSDDKKQGKVKGNGDKKELVKEQRGNVEPNNSGQSLEVELNKTTTKKTEDDVPELDVQGKRKRKSVDLYIPQRIRPKKKKKSVESTFDSTENKENIDNDGIDVGDVGYTFKKWFKAPYSLWYDGEVVELVEINGTIYRRCRYADGDVEDYTIEYMAKYCKPRSWTWHNKR